MEKRSFPLIAVFLSLWLLGARGTGRAQAGGAPRGRPNILLIFSDDHAFQAISAYGSRLVPTPHIDRLAREGALFANSFVTNSLCAPSRATLLTGTYSHVHGVTRNEQPPDSSCRFFPELLQQHGYQTAWIGKWHLGIRPRGFDHFRVLPGQGDYYNPDFIGSNGDTVRLEGYVTDLLTHLSRQWLDRRNPDKPFFLVVGEKAAHRPWLPALQDLGAYDSLEFPLPPTFFDRYEGRLAAQNQDMTIDKTLRLKEDLKVQADFEKDPAYQRLTAAQRQVLAGYYGAAVTRPFEQGAFTGEALLRWKYQRYMKDYLSVARSLDRNIGALLDYLDSTGLSENTVVIYASDQGFYLGEHGWFDKRFMYEESLRTPFVLRYPGVVAAGTRINGFTANIDWAPTLLDIAGLDVPAHMQGVSFLPLLQKGEGAVPWRKEVYYHYYEYPRPHQVAPHFGIRTETFKLIRFYGPQDAWELYDLQKDAGEVHNVYGAAAYRRITEGLKDRLEQWIRQYRDAEALRILEAEAVPPAPLPPPAAR